jgi:hypothetical protein
MVRDAFDAMDFMAVAQISSKNQAVEQMMIINATGA